MALAVRALTTDACLDAEGQCLGDKLRANEFRTHPRGCTVGVDAVAKQVDAAGRCQLNSGGAN